MRCLGIGLFLAWCSFAFGQKQVMNVYFFGQKSGTSTYELKGDGSWTGVVVGNVAGQEIAFKMAGKLVKDRVAEYRVEADQAGKKVLIVVSGGHAKVSVDGKQQLDREIKGLPAVAMGNFLPQIATTVIASYDLAKKGQQQLDLLLLDSAAVHKASVEYKGAYKYKGRALDEWSLGVAGVNVRLVAESKPPRVVGMDVPSQSYQQIAVGYDDLFVDPTTLDKTLSQPTFKAKIEKGVKAAMRDGVQLVSEIALPEGDGKYPTILVRTPYGRGPQFLGIKAEWWAKRGYAVVVQDCRGREDSEGEWNPFVNEKNDGYDTIDWISKQPWSDGKVGMIGGSYSGLVQWQAAVMKHPALKCIVPQVSPPDAFFNIPYDHGSFFLFGNLWWSDIVREKKTHLERAANRDLDWPKMATLPLVNVDDAFFGSGIPWFDMWLKRDKASDWADWNFQEQMGSVDIPALHISGWFDGDGVGTKTNWARMASARRTNQWLIYGPWTHAFNTSTKIGDMDFGAGAILDLDSVYLRWFDTWLKGQDAKLTEKLPKAQIFVSGVNEWRAYDAWPDSRAVAKSLYLSSDGPANGDSSRGRLVEGTPGNEEPDRYTYNPADTNVPDALKNIDPENPQTALKIDPNEEDLLVYKTDPMKEPMEIGGPFSVDLFFSSSAQDCDLIATILDMDEKGDMRPIGISGRIRARYLSGWSTPEALEPNRVYQATIEPWDSAHQFKKGHRMVLLIDSGDWPMYARNLGTMEPIATGTKMVAQSQTVYHDSSHPSAIRFYLLPAKK